jgi:hypothetical protein
MTTNLSTHPKVVRISNDLKADRLKVVGGLHAVWSTFDQHSTDGMLENYSPRLLDSIIGWKGFSDSLISVGWLIESDNSLMLKDFEDHNGKSAKERSQNAKRMSNTRACEKSADSNRTKGAPDKIREDKSISKDIQKVADAPVVFPQALDCDAFKEAWGQWQSHLKQKKVKPTPIASKMQLKKLGEMGLQQAIAAIHHSIAGNYQGIFEPKGAFTTPQASEPVDEWAAFPRS